MQKLSLMAGVVLGFVTVAILSAALGFAFGVDSTGEDLNQNIIPILSMVGGWVSGIGALFAGVVALWIAENQAKHEHQQDAVRCIHHSLAIINDLRGRVHSMRLMLTEGRRPLAALTKNAEAIQRRYEALYDRDIYRHAPGHVVDLITSMSGSFFGLSVLVDGIASSQNIAPHQPISLPSDDSTQPIFSTLFELEGELDELFTQFVKVRENIVG